MDDLFPHETILRHFSDEMWQQVCDRAEIKLMDAMDWVRLHPEEAKEKFLEGRQEHSDDLMQLDCVKEMQEEGLDIANYSLIHDLQQGFVYLRESYANRDYL